MVKKRCGRWANKHQERGKAKLLLLLRYANFYMSTTAQTFACVLIFIFEICYQDALRAADFKEYRPQTRESLSCWNPECIGFNLIEYLLCYICENEKPGAVLVFMTGWDDISSLKDKLQAHPLLGDPNQVLLLACHGSMASSEQVILLCINFIF